MFLFVEPWASPRYLASLEVREDGGVVDAVLRRQFLDALASLVVVDQLVDLAGGEKSLSHPDSPHNRASMVHRSGVMGTVADPVNPTVQAPDQRIRLRGKVAERATQAPRRGTVLRSLRGTEDSAVFVSIAVMNKPGVLAIIAIISVCFVLGLALGMGGPLGLLGSVGVAGVGIGIAAATSRRRPELSATASPLELAQERHRFVLDDYASWEFDPEMLLRFPGLWDRSRPEPQRFFDALAAATHAEPEGPGTPEQVARYTAAVDELRMAWAGAERYARSTGTSALSPTHRAEAETGLKLYRHAQGAASDEERQTYYRRALDSVRSLIQAGLLPATLPAVERLESAQRGELT